MNSTDFLTELSKEVSYALRHAPWEYELELDEEGFVPVRQLLYALNEPHKYEHFLTVSDLERMISNSDKKRHEIVDGKIRALYGHSVPMFIKKEAGIPPKTLYHGTKSDALESIMKDGLKPMQRQYVHMSVDTDTAVAVASRRFGDNVILVIDTESAVKDGIQFFIGNDKVWLANEVPPKYISTLKADR